MTRVWLAIFGLLLLSSQAIGQQAGDWLVRVGGGYVNPNTSSNDLVAGGTTLAGYQIDVGSDTQPIVNLTYMATDNIGIEVLAALPFEHDINGAEALDGVGRLGKTKHLPPTISLQYHIPLTQAFRPYVGAGLNYTTFFSSKTTDTLDGALGGSSSLSIKDSMGLAFQLGTDIDIGSDWFFNVDLRYIYIEADATIKTQTSEGLLTSKIKADLDPWVFSAGVGWRF